MLNVCVLYGGRSGEHDVSLCSAASVISALDRNKYSVTAVGITRDGRWHVQDHPVIVDDKDFGKVLELKETGTWTVNHYEEKGKLVLRNTENGKTLSGDVVFPVLHGTFCEDGTLQGLLELAMVPYVGADVLGSAVGMDKDVSKRLLRDGGIPVVPWITVTDRQWRADRGSYAKMAENFGFPLFVKPANAGSSVGVKKIKSEHDLYESVEFSLQYDNKVLIEKAVNAREIECAVLGNESPEASVLGEVVPNHEFYSYEAKYIDPEGAKLKIPAPVEPGTAEEMRRTALKAFRLLNCAGMARIDFFLEKDTDSFYLNEINTLPGFTNISMYPKLWEKSGLSYKDLLDRLIELSMDRYKEKIQLIREM
ncbi:MAG TPA: D-alanine--D-alanine ligase family protein [Spirochaetota bacterium]|nr:D-alanine--D-alanine ligase family protein [Spirochaetota bacterium]HPI88066.1 D-alanine--D-alanine ligase family protein [Spirochaetota bacterium]HPR46449.1 D-alanine--D-alanine ligase family protein [Spirochaetota bacterium]